jgi:hypothetical protein
MALVGVDGLPISSRNPFAQQKLSDFPVMDAEKVGGLVASAQHLLDQRTPLEVPSLALTTGDFCVLARTIQFLFEHYTQQQEKAAQEVAVAAAYAAADAAPGYGLTAEEMKF